MEEITLISDSRVRAITVEDCGEPLEDLTGHLMLDERMADEQRHFQKIRSGVLRRLVDAQKVLPAGVHFLLYEGYRPVATQEKIYEQYRLELKRRNPRWDAAELDRATSRWVAPVDVAPHTAGAAVDITLCDAEGIELDLGTAGGATPEESDFACYTDAANISAEAVANRQVMGNALRSAGLVNYPTEWWHWSYGDRYWALMTRAPHAIYGVAFGQE